MRANSFDIADLKLCTEDLLVQIVDRVSRICGLYTCCACDRPLSPLCETCEGTILYATPSCVFCEKFSENGKIHHNCAISSLYYTNSLSCFYYTKTIKRLLHLYKYDAAFQYQRVIEQLITKYFEVDPFRIVNYWRKLLFMTRIALIPIPMTRKKESERGFSPAFEITVILARILNQLLFANSTIKVFPSILKKQSDTIAQAKKNRRNRLLSLQKAYIVNPAAVDEFCNFSPQAIIVVDDVITTGATTTIAIEQLAKDQRVHKTIQKIPIVRFSFACV